VAKNIRFSMSILSAAHPPYVVVTMAENRCAPQTSRIIGRYITKTTFRWMFEIAHFRVTRLGKFHCLYL